MRTPNILYGFFFILLLWIGSTTPGSATISAQITVSDATPDLALASSPTGQTEPVTFMVSGSADAPDGQQKEKKQSLLNWDFLIKTVTTDFGSGPVQQSTSGLTLNPPTTVGMSASTMVNGPLPRPGATIVKVQATVHTDTESKIVEGSGKGDGIYFSFSGIPTNSITTGLDKGVDGCKVKVARMGVVLDVTPASFVKKLKVTANIPNALKIDGVTAAASGATEGTITFNVVGEIAPPGPPAPPAVAPPPTQYFLFAADKSGADLNPKTHLAVKIVYPYSLTHASIPFRKADGFLNKVNSGYFAVGGTSYYGFSAYTIWYIKTTIPVLDEYGNALDALYNGQTVTENGGHAFDIAVDGAGIISSGSYIDPVGPATSKFTPSKPTSDTKGVKGLMDDVTDLNAGTSFFYYDAPNNPTGEQAADRTVEIDGITIPKEITNRTTNGRTTATETDVSVTWPTASPGGSPSPTP